MQTQHSGKIPTALASPLSPTSSICLGFYAAAIFINLRTLKSFTLVRELLLLRHDFFKTREATWSSYNDWLRNITLTHDGSGLGFGYLRTRRPAEILVFILIGPARLSFHIAN